MSRSPENIEPQIPSAQPIHTYSSYSDELKLPKKKSAIVSFLKSKLFLSILIVGAVFVTLLIIGLVLVNDQDNGTEDPPLIDEWNVELSKEQEYWYNLGMDELREALSIEVNKKIARNVILFVGDGMGQTTVTASRIYKFGEKGRLSWEKFPNMGLLKTYCYDRQVPDSITTGTALFGGIKNNYQTGGVDSAVPANNCSMSLKESHRVRSIIQLAMEEGRSTGFVTTTRVTHATPAGLYAHISNRNWECEARMSDDVKQEGCKDIGRQMIEDYPGRDINVIMGGGRQCLISNVQGTVTDPIDTWSCQSSDGRNLTRDWEKNKMMRELRYRAVSSPQELYQMNSTEIDYVLGIFANGHLSYDHERVTNNMPSIKEMTVKAIEVLEKNSNGFLLVVEGGMIDMAHHRGWARQALSETAAMDEAVAATLNKIKPYADETLVIVTSDHSHSLSINGYPKFGNSILGIASDLESSQIPYTTLTYATGGPDSFQYRTNEAGDILRRDPSNDNIYAYDYVQQAAIKTDENLHEGTDVAVYAIGPWAHLFHRVHEQSYVAHVISYAARLGRFKNV